MRMEEIFTRSKEIEALMPESSGEALAALEKELDELNEERSAIKADEEKRAAMLAKINDLGAVVETAPVEEKKGTEMDEREIRANEFVKSGRMQIRQLLASGNIAKPTKVDGISELAEVASGIVDDVNAIQLTGAGSWTVAYKASDAAAAAVTDGSAVAGTASTYNYVTINPAEWGVLDEISKQVAKMSPLDYENAIKNSAVIALRATASSKIFTALAASSLIETRLSMTLNQDYLRKVVLGFRAIAGKGEPVLYIAQADLITLGAVRGTNEKRPLYEIKFDQGTTTSGVISEGGLAVKFRVDDNLVAGVQYFGQPKTIDMPMWDQYSVETDEGGDYFKRNMIGIRGLQTANADLVAYHGMQKIKQAAS